ncbi:MAG TPA: phosphoribosyltransferase [Euryarchaeota archaeon]|nr:phosphoribosyltransferase [Euryarchaeota archaeon]
MAEKFKCRFVTWEDIVRWVKDVAEKIRNSGYKPDVIVALARGGWIPGRLLCDHLLVKDLYSLKTEHWGITATRDGKAKVVHDVPVSLKDKRVLIMDDITDTGQSLSLALEHVKKHNPAEVKTAAMLHITHSKFVPDYFSEEVPAEDWTWFIFPWNYYEDMRNLITQILKEGEKTIEELIDLFKRYYELETTTNQLLEVLQLMEKEGFVKRSNSRWALIKAPF